MDSHESSKAFLRVLRHRAIASATDLEVLEDIAKNGKSERHRLRAAAILTKARKEMAHLSAYHEGQREETLERKGLAKSSVHVRHSLDLGDLPLAQLQRLAEGDARAPRAEVLEVREEVTNSGQTDPKSGSGATSAQHARQPDPSDGDLGLSGSGDIASPESMPPSESPESEGNGE